MNALFALLHVSNDFLAFAGTHIIAAQTGGGKTLAQNISTWLGPLLTLGIGIVAISFLVQRQMTQFFQFLAIAVIVAMLFFKPDVIQTLGTTFASFF